MKKRTFCPLFLVIVVSFFASSFALSVRPEPIAGNYDLFRDSTGRLSAVAAYYGENCFAYQNAWVLTDQAYFNHISSDGTQCLQRIDWDSTTHFVIWDHLEQGSQTHLLVFNLSGGISDVFALGPARSLGRLTSGRAAVHQLCSKVVAMSRGFIQSDGVSSDNRFQNGMTFKPRKC